MVPTNVIAQFVRGFFMGAADIVPGVSGGTVALVFGIYERFLGAIRTGAHALGSLAKGDVRSFAARLRDVDWMFFIPLVVGIGVAFVGLSGVIEGLLHDHPETMAGLFFGLVLGSIWVAWRLLKDRTSQDLIIMLAVGAVMFVLLGFSAGPAIAPPLWAYFGAGAIAICAMILPGISGSFLLLMMGMYAALLGAVHDRDLVPIIVFMVGATIGLAIFSTFLGRLLDRAHDTVIAVLIGLMIGSLRVLWPWPHGVGVISEDAAESIPGTGLEFPAIGDFWGPAIIGLVAAVVVVGVSEFASARSVPESVSFT